VTEETINTAINIRKFLSGFQPDTFQKLKNRNRITYQKFHYKNIGFYPGGEGRSFNITE
jgi:hypothetical protein